MARMIVNISLPETMKEFIEMRAGQGFASISDYFRQLVRKDERKWLKRREEAIERQSMYRTEAIPRNSEVDLDCDY